MNIIHTDTSRAVFLSISGTDNLEGVWMADQGKINATKHVYVINFFVK